MTDNNINITNLQDCFICNKPVIDIDSEFEDLDVFYFNDENDPVFLEKAFGVCHSKCLIESKWSSYWYTKQLNRYRNIQKYSEIELDSGPHIFYKNRDIVVLFNDARTIKINEFDLVKALRDIDSNVIFKSLECNLEFDDSEFTNYVRDQLVKNKIIYLSEITTNVGMNNKFISEDTLNSSKLIFDQELQQDWIGNWISARLEYNIQVPSLLSKTIKKIIKAI